LPAIIDKKKKIDNHSGVEYHKHTPRKPNERKKTNLHAHRLYHSLPEKVSMAFSGNLPGDQRPIK